MEKLARHPFSLTAFLLAPWPAPLLCSLALMLGMGSPQPGALFLVTLGAGLIVSYLGTAALVVFLWFFAYVRAATKTITVLAGAVIATLGYLPFIFVMWHSSGPDSGPPEDSFSSHLLRSLNEPYLYLFAGAGLITALLYHSLARWSQKPALIVSAE